jgi:hypothetical protein
MQPLVIDRITERLHELPPEKLNVVWDFVSYLAEREREQPEAYQTMTASERVLARDWDRPEEELAWANL